MLRLVGYSEAGLARQRIRPDKMQDWSNRGWAEHQIRHWHFLRNAEKHERGKIVRSTRTGPVKTQEKLIKRGLERAIVEERKLDRGVACTCPESADHGFGCPMRRPSRNPSFKKVILVWSHGDGRVYCADPNATPWEEQLTKNGYEPATADEISQPSRTWNHFHLFII
eukprot:3822909-Pyramimonas_sp.AAC.1